MYADSAFITKAQTIVAAMKGNKHFTTPVPQVTAVEDAITKFDDALTASQDGSRIAAAEKNQCRSLLEDLLRQWVAYVTMVAGGDLNILTSSSFDVYKDRESRPAVSEPQIISMVSGKNPGEVEIKIKCDTAISYIYEYTTDPLTDASVWTPQVNTLKTHLLTGLKPLSKIWVRVTAIGRGGAKATGEPMSYNVQ